MTSIILDAVALGLFFQRVARAQQRARTIIFSARAVVREIGGSCYLMFQVCDVRKRQVRGRGTPRARASPAAP